MALALVLAMVRVRAMARAARDGVHSRRRGNGEGEGRSGGEQTTELKVFLLMQRCIWPPLAAHSFDSFSA